MNILLCLSEVPTPHHYQSCVKWINSKSQITNVLKAQAANPKPCFILKRGNQGVFRSLDIGAWNLFGAWCLEFGASIYGVPVYANQSQYPTLKTENDRLTHYVGSP
jgi:hypothetical protein